MKELNAVEDYTHLTGGTWTTDDEKNKLIDTLLHNYKIIVSDVAGVNRRNKFTISVGDELPADCENGEGYHREEAQAESRG